MTRGRKAYATRRALALAALAVGLWTAPAGAHPRSKAGKRRPSPQARGGASHKQRRGDVGRDLHKRQRASAGVVKLLRSFADHPNKPYRQFRDISTQWLRGHDWTEGLHRLADFENLPRTDKLAIVGAFAGQTKGHARHPAMAAAQNLAAVYAGQKHAKLRDLRAWEGSFGHFWAAEVKQQGQWLDEMKSARPDRQVR